MHGNDLICIELIALCVHLFVFLTKKHIFAN